MAFVKVKPNTTEVIKLNQAEPSGEKDNYGNDVWHVNGGDKFTPSATLSSMMQETIAQNDLGAGDSLAIIRSGAGRDTRWTVEPAGQASPKTVDDIADPFESMFEKGQAPGKPMSSPNPPRTFDDLSREYMACIKRGQQIAEEIFGDNATTEDVRAIGTSLYIQANREGLELPKV